MSTEHLSHQLLKQISSVVEESYLEEISNHGTLPHNAVVISPSSPHRLYLRGGSLSRWSPHIGRTARSPCQGRSPLSSFHSSPGNSLRVQKPLLEDEIVLIPDEDDVDDCFAERSCKSCVSFTVVCTMIFFNGCCFTAVVPSVPFYLQQLSAQPSFLGWVVSFYSLGQIIGSPTAGWLTSEMTSKHLLTISSTLGLLSSAVYAVAPAPFFVLISRLITGISAGMEFATELTFIAENTTTNERTTFLATVTAVNVLGFIMGPALGMLLSLLDINVFGYVVDQYTGPGWLLATMFTVDLIMVRRLFESDEIDMDHKADHKAPTSESVILLDHAQDLDNNDNSYGAISMRPKSQRKSLENVDEVQTPSLTLVLSMIFIQFTLMSGWSILETITSPLAQADFGWDMLQCNLLFTAGGAVSLLAYVIFVKVSKWVHDRWLVANALILCFIGFVLAIDWRQLNMTPAWIAHNLPSYLYRFIAGYFLMNAGFMTGRPVTFALYSKLIASESQGTHLGWMVAGGSAARTLGPFIAVRLFYGFERGGMNLLALFGSAAIFHLTSLTLVCLEWSNLLPKQEESSTARKRNSTASTDVEDCRFSSDDEIPEGVCHHRDQERATDRFC